MRAAMILLAAASLCACTQEETGAGGQAAAASLTTVSFDGADYKTNPEKLAHGARLARVLGCLGCHGDNLQGTNVTKDDPGFGDMNAPNLTLLVPLYSDAELDRAIRAGVPRDGREFWFMPSEAYQFLSDSDMSALIAYLRTYRAEGKQMPPLRVGEGLRKQVAEGSFANAEGMLRRYRDDPPPDLGEQHRMGRHLSRVVCAECHNSALQGFEDFTPDLDIAGAYSHAELEALLTTGKGKAKPDLGLMTLSAGRFAKLTARERKAIIDYVKARAERPH
ncbi:c-type cytochrome [Sphingomonas arenae]|uniref:c-type cytochrome n=1 Tax=Sphingomonas arenae TaxID=2812555 RepID=UPI001967EE41|nr:c-type cytochrome [Sphingomonas arenae]